MIDKLEEWLSKLPPLNKDRKPNVAAVWGFFLGGVGLAIYFRSFVDFLIPIAIAVVAIVVVSGIGGSSDFAALGWLPGAIISGLYGYYRAVTSNAKRATQSDVLAPAVPTSP